MTSYLFLELYTMYRGLVTRKIWYGSEEPAAASSTLKMAEAAGSSKMLLQIC
jgi:hypothetical protein